MSEQDRLIAAVRARTEGTPYKVTPTDAGFDVGIDIENTEWFALLYKENLSMTWIYHVQVDATAKKISITDEARTVHWKAGATTEGGVPRPVISGSAAAFRGRAETKSFQKVYAFNGKGEYGKVVDYRFDASEGRALIREPARELGWDEQMGTAQKIGVGIAVATVVLLILAGIAVGILALTGVL